jgi:ABC-2 type transport system permease protein
MQQVMPALERPLTAVQSAAGFLTLVEKTVRSRLTYRMSTLLSVISNALGYAVVLLVWREVYRERQIAAAVTDTALFPYLVCAFVLNFTLTLAMEARVGQRMRMGLITCDLLRPIGFTPFQFAQAIGDVIMNLLLVLPVYTLAWLVLGNAVLPADGAAFLLGTLSVVLAFLVNFGISYLIVQVGFVTQSFYGVLFTRISLHQVFSGLLAPLAMFPESLRDVAAFLPFRHVIETPARLWLGHVPASEIAPLLALQALWGLGLLLVSTSALSAALKRHQIQGG